MNVIELLKERIEEELYKKISRARLFFGMTSKENIMFLI